MDADPYWVGLHPSPPPPQRPYKVCSPFLPLPRNAVSMHRQQPPGVTTVSSPLKTKKMKTAHQMPHTSCKNNGLTRQAAKSL